MRIAAIVAACALLAAGVAEAAPGDRLRERLRERMAERSAGQDATAPRVAPSETIAYGSDPLQQIDLYRPRATSAAAPLVVYVHGGGWKRGSRKTTGSRTAPEHFTGLGYAYASIDYRLVPAATVEQQASDVAHAVKALVDRADRLGIDRNRIVLIGHSAGAHLVSLVGTDEQYLRGAGLSFADIDGIIPNDGAAYDVPQQIAEGGRFMHDTYVQAFGTDPARQRALSPTFHAGSPNAPSFLLIHVQRKDGVAQNKELEAALRRAGTAVERHEFPGTGLQGHAEINRRLGEPDYAATPVVDDWLRRVFAR